jgi:AcrR family transcriptional regulator
VATRSERSEATRTRIVDASVAVLVEVGLDGFTTPAVAGRAGVAQGSVFRYFPTKRDLLVATVDAAIRSTTADHVDLLLRRLEEDRPVGDAAMVRLVIEVLWAAYSDERVVAAYEVRSRCRTDAELRDAIIPVLESTDVGGADVFSLLVPESFRLPGADFRATTRLITNAMQGRAFTRASLPDPAADATLLDVLCELVLDRVRAVRAPSEPTPEVQG